MNEPKRRGRPPKAKVEGITEPHINGDTSREPEEVLPVKAKIATFSSAVVEGARRIEPGESVQVYVDPFTTKRAQAYALRVWQGQSTDIHRAERISRVKLALEAQGLSFEGVELP